MKWFGAFPALGVVAFVSITFADIATAGYNDVRTLRKGSQAFAVAAGSSSGKCFYSRNGGAYVTRGTSAVAGCIAKLRKIGYK